MGGGGWASQVREQGQRGGGWGRRRGVGFPGEGAGPEGGWVGGGWASQVREVGQRGGGREGGGLPR